MTQNKHSYYLGGGGVSEPTPGKKKYKSEKAIVIRPRFKEPLYQNYDLYETPGADGKPSKTGPGVGQHSFHKYKSMADFIADKRKRMKGRYVADDLYRADDGADKKKKDRVKKIKARIDLLSQITKTAIDFTIDEYFENTNNPVGQANLIGGHLNSLLPHNDSGNNLPINLDSDSVSNSEEIESTDHVISVNKLMDKYLNTNTENELNSEYVISDDQNGMYGYRRNI